MARILIVEDNPANTPIIAPTSMALPLSYRKLYAAIERLLSRNGLPRISAAQQGSEAP